MSTAAGIAFGIGFIILAIALLAIAFGGSTPATGTKPTGWDNSDAAQEWDEKLRGLGGDFGLKTIRETAGKWGTSVAALLGILSTVAFVAGPSDLVKDVGGTWADVAAWLILGAAAFAAIATLLAALAEQGVPSYADDLEGWQLRNLTKARAKQAAGQLQASRVLAVVALLCIIAATGVAWLSALTGKEDDAASQDAIVTGSAGATCGTLAQDGATLTLKVDGTTQPIPSGAQVTLVDGCPG